MANLFYGVDNWSIFELFGGFTLVLATIARIFYLVINRKIEEAIKHGYNKKIEETKGEINRENGILDSITRNHLLSNQKILDRKIEAYELLWVRILDIKASMPSAISTIHFILTDKEFEDAAEFKRLDNGKYGPIFRSYDTDTILDQILSKEDKLAVLRPYLSDVSFKLFLSIEL
jgi:hypothetical protein